LISLCNVEGACDRTPFDHVFRGSAWSCYVSLGFGWACLCNVRNRGVVCVVYCCVGARGVVWNVSGSFTPQWSMTLSASPDEDVYRLFCWWNGIGRLRSFWHSCKTGGYVRLFGY